MAAPKGGGKGGGGAKKAKLAHEKRGQEESGERGQFRLKNVIELVTDRAGKAGAVVELDDKGTLGIVDARFVLKGADGSVKAREVACPATYDLVAQKSAVQRYQAFKA
ncbi:MAG: hypothetical protein IT385_19920 [Deltaproteobacteria bacterium]|nr:hypothetical protein [Deltaproteobacteria bacterium]